MDDEETLYARYLSGELTKAELEELDKNGDLQKIDRIINATDGFRLPPVDKKRGFQKLLEAKRSEKNNVRRITFLQWVSGIAAAFLIGLFLYLFTRSDVIQLNTDFAQTLEHQFEDNSRTVLNAGSQIQFDKNKWDSERKIALKGEAFFDVEPGVPFEVITSQGVVQVLGTEFNVRSRTNELSVQCFEGRVKVLANNVEQTLTVQQGITIRNTTVTETYTLDNSEPYWQIGRTLFRNSPVEEVFQELERQFDIKVESDITDMNFRGSFDNNDLDTAVNEIAQPLGLIATISPDRKQVTFSK